MPGIRTAQLNDSVGVLDKLFDRHVLTTAFAGGPPQLNADVAVDADLEFELFGTNAASLTSCVHDAGGGVKLLTAGADNDQAGLFPHADTQQSAWNLGFDSGESPAFAALIKTGSAITLQKIHAGFALTAALDETTDADQVKFTYDTDSSDANWQCNVSIDGTDTEVDSGVAVAADTAYLFEVVVGSDRKARFWIDGTLVHTTAALTDAKALKPIVGVQALAAAAKHMYVRRIACARNLG